MDCRSKFGQQLRVFDLFPQRAGHDDVRACGHADGGRLRILDSATGNDGHLGRLAGVGDVFHRHGFFGTAARFQVHVAHAHKFSRNGIHHTKLGFVGRYRHRAADVFDRGTLAAIDQLVRRRNRFHVERAHERTATHLFINQVVRIATAHEGHEKHRVKAWHHLGGATREQHHGQVHIGLEGSHLLGQRKVTQVRTAHQQKVGTIFGGHRARLHKSGFVRRIGVQQHGKKRTAFFDFSIQTKFGLTRFHTIPFLASIPQDIIKIQYFSFHAIKK